MNTQWNDTKNDKVLKIGYYACQKRQVLLVFDKWGINIRSKVDCDELTDYVANNFDDIVISLKNTKKDISDRCLADRESIKNILKQIKKTHSFNETGSFNIPYLPKEINNGKKKPVFINY